MSANIKDSAFEARDKITDISSMLCLVEKSISEIEHVGDDIIIAGTSAVIWQVIKILDEVNKDLTQHLKG